MRSKVTVIGAGNVGATCAQRLAEKGYADVVLVDIIEGLPQGKALDILQSGPVLSSDSNIIGTNGYDETADSDVVIITSGFPRQPGMSREDLLDKNKEIIQSVTTEVVKRSPNCAIIVVTNPLDTMVYLTKHVSGFPKGRVMGMAGILDTARLRSFIAMELNVSVEDTQAFILGGHGDDMVPIPRYCTVAGVPITQLIPGDRIEKIVERTRKAGGEIVALLKKGSAFYSPSASAIQMAESILKDKKRIVPCAAYLEGEYGLNDIYFGVPVKLGSGGVEEVIEVELTDEERAAVQKSADGVKKSIAELKL